MPTHATPQQPGKPEPQPPAGEQERKKQENKKVDTASRDSMIASDPPGYAPVHPGEPKNKDRAHGERADDEAADDDKAGRTGRDERGRH